MRKMRKHFDEKPLERVFKLQTSQGRRSITMTSLFEASQSVFTLNQ